MMSLYNIYFIIFWEKNRYLSFQIFNIYKIFIYEFRSHDLVAFVAFINWPICLFVDLIKELHQVYSLGQLL